ncbi:hypothetical protein E1B28_004246 [Marasmius oreades]|uniref:PIN domain-containing protein n=1 Tax=Marasmius oreades TaxID=181124 RepID=A0A9P8ACQ4_9AGAR|nr:uncharacterized protein E1B28_004246 [Marasmius oreades]KAG7096837.1 hypothetical protein E1B28_004246 [Marasmius oreades]
MSQSETASNGYSGVFYHAALRRFEEIANDDVEMKAPLSERTRFVVIDTNIVLHHLDSLIQFVDDVEYQKLPVVVIVPNIVTRELDTKKGTSWFARHASSWLLKKSRERKVVKGQAMHETDNRHGLPKTNDDRILRCAIYFNHIGQTYLYSGDNNLCMMTEPEHIITITPSPRISSRDIAKLINWDGLVDLDKFAECHRTYSKYSTITSQESTINEDSMMMDVDGEVKQSELDFIISRADAKTSLHLQIVDHFTALLAELVSRIHGVNPLLVDGASLSIHAPKMVRSAAMNEPRNKNYAEWTATELLDHLERRKSVLPAVKPYLGVFLTKPYYGPYTGARRGEDWSTKDWQVSLSGLRQIAKAWGDQYILESLDEVEKWHLQKVLFE